jgi:LPPG:FO 2-phospho-L-lactate transferase
VGLRIVALAGGVGGAKLADGLARNLRQEDLSVVVNTGDDFEHFGLQICPDLDTMTYTLAGLADPARGWGRADESWHFLQTLELLGGPTWFQLGDRDLALHVERTRRLRQGQTLTEVTEHIRGALGVAVAILPMSDQPVATIVLTDEGPLPFQEYFVARRCEPRVRGLLFKRSEQAAPSPKVRAALKGCDAVVFCPSNPWVSLDPILDLPGMRELVQGKPVVGVSPIVGGRALKGPAAKMFRQMGVEPSSLAVAKHYQGLLSGLVIDVQDAEQEQDVAALGVKVLVTNTIMKDVPARSHLGKEVLDFVRGLV